ncbi:ATP/GTP-binding protein [Frigoribacterium sp. Leaf263]|uniref:hypothetical protein n=1 Tax=Frigoribacterium sp. Leaf263 TaxID=1736313 RepID=UPI0007021BA5|nr:hypothetical protein [Frigoribacterium sp. Leaf263]KQO82575.1 ATP/GTP-binding protein [Frigoribacterium sp. Leaf263]
MPRSNRPRRPRDARRADEPAEDITRALRGGAVVESRHGRSFTVQSIGASSSVKEYICPGCSLTVAPGTAHVVVWRADGLFGEADDLASRRHWHTHCWRIS